MSSATAQSDRRPLLLGHRGVRAVKATPENTFPSFDRALADGCDGFEFDVRLTADNKAVVCHDPKVGRLEIIRSSANQFPSLPRLGDVLARYRRVFLDVELKVAGLEQITIESVKEQQIDRFVVSSFLPEVLRACHTLDSAIPLGLICDNDKQLQRWKELPIGYVMPHRKLVRQALLSEFHDAGKKVIVWTVNAAKEMRRFAEWGVDGIISDNTKLLAATLS